MSAIRWARGFVLFFVLVLTSLANLLFVPVDTDGDDSTPPVIFSFKFVASRTAGHNRQPDLDINRGAASRPEPIASSINLPIILNSSEMATAVPLTPPLRC
jgi:hypothetical protein